MRLPEYIIEMLRKKSGNDLYLPSDCEFLSLDIESNLGIHIGATTLKRLLGFANDERTPHASTLEVLAKYLGYAHWRDVIHHKCAALLVSIVPKMKYVHPVCLWVIG